MKAKTARLFEPRSKKPTGWFFVIGGMIVASFFIMAVIWQSVNTMEKVRLKEQDLLMDHIAQTARLFIQEGQLDYFYRIIALLTRISFIENLAVYQDGQRILQAGSGEQKRLDDFLINRHQAEKQTNPAFIFRERNLSVNELQKTELRAVFSLREVEEPKRAIRLSFFVITALMLTVGILATKLQFMLRRMEEIERIKGHMVNSISHDASHDLGVIHHKIFEMLEQKRVLFKSVRVEKDLKIVMESVDSMVRYLDNLKDQKRLGLGAVDVKPEPVEMARLIRSVADSFREKLHIRQMKLALEKMPASLQAWVTPQIVKRVLMNLIHNAVKYSPPGGCIEISAEKNAGQILVCVRDRGAGIDPGYWEKIFEPYWQLKPDSPGIGLGLFISRQLIRMSGGELRVTESIPGGGTVFCFVLPAYAGQKPKAEPCRAS